MKYCKLCVSHASCEGAFSEVLSPSPASLGASTETCVDGSERRGKGMSWDFILKEQIRPDYMLLKQHELRVTWISAHTAELDEE